MIHGSDQVLIANKSVKIKKKPPYPYLFYLHMRSTSALPASRTPTLPLFSYSPAISSINIFIMIFIHAAALLAFCCCSWRLIFIFCCCSGTQSSDSHGGSSLGFRRYG